MYREYGDEINFVWVYGAEGHPEEQPFVLGFETIDLGWTHRYYVPQSMEERARRARLMKTDLEPNAQIPMMIDYVNSDLGPDNAIKQAYVGSGFYSGFVIDCDGTVIHEVGWAWRAPGGHWWGLPLAMMDDLRGFLDNYLANLPACYDPKAQRRARPTTPSRSPDVLIVDDDDGDVHESYYKVPLGSAKLHYEVWDVQAEGSPPVAVLQSYPAVVWLTGSSQTNTLTGTDRANLGAYLDGGGQLLLSGQHIGAEIGATDFYRDYLHAELVNNVVGTRSVRGADLLAEYEFSISGIEGASNQTAPDEIALRDGAVGIFKYDVPDQPAWAGLRWSSDDYRVVYLGFGFEGIGTTGAAAFRFKIMRELMAWFGLRHCPGDVDADNDVDLDDLAWFIEVVTAPGDTGQPAGVPRVFFRNADFEYDGDVDLRDFMMVQGHTGVDCPE